MARKSSRTQRPSAKGESLLPLAQLTPALRQDQWELCGRFGRPHGVRGDVRLWMYNKQSDLLVEGADLFVGAHPRDGDPAPLPSAQLTVSKIRFDAKGAIVTFAELKRREEATLLTHQAWLTPRSLFPELEEDEFYLTDLIGAQGLLFPIASDEDDPEAARPLGQLTGLVEAGAGEIFVFEGSQFGEVMVPNLDPFVIEIDLSAKLVKVREIPGLIEGGRKDG